MVTNPPVAGPRGAYAARQIRGQRAHLRKGREGALPAFTCGTRESESARRPGTGGSRSEICGRRDRRRRTTYARPCRSARTAAGDRRRKQSASLPLHPDPSVCGPGSARLLLFSCPAGPGYRKGDETQLRDDRVLTTDEQADALGRVGISSAFTAASGRCGGDVIPKTKTRSVRPCSAMSQGLRVAGKPICSGSPAGQPKPRP